MSDQKSDCLETIEEYPETAIPSLGPRRILSPLLGTKREHVRECFVTDYDRVLIDVDLFRVETLIERGDPLAAFELAGPREQIYFDPSKVKCALTTCGGLCPGLNDVIRSIVLELIYGYGVHNIFGIRYGLQGFISKYGHDIMHLSPESVGQILATGGSILGSSRGPQPIDEIVDCLERLNAGILFMIGGDGTLMAATKIADTIANRGLKIAVIGIPKTIDNDIYLVSRSFGFDTAVDLATQAIIGAHKESEGYPNGIGLIKLMGRYSGFIAATATLAQQDVNFALIPEVDFDLDGPKGFLQSLERRLKLRGHAVIVVAEGTGQKFFLDKKKDHDASGNIKLQDIGIFLKEIISDYFQSKEVDISLKYIDPSYIIRSLPANANDRVFCSALARNAVHAGMAGKTKMMVGYWNDRFAHIPMAASAGRRKQVNPRGRLWSSVLEATGQGLLKNPS
ncbi:MAG: diphosphate--fructose-6-phosphate 1-phosphotransferase [Deltaproteobacteria bacterium RBG_13_49_15]|nr:MAG: diphosphate--fructose-6-phosphate 1-phosphotransferase [Deltaproteobacteria bacterium RBG_13_49_15]